MKSAKPWDHQVIKKEKKKKTVDYENGFIWTTTNKRKKKIHDHKKHAGKFTSLVKMLLMMEGYWQMSDFFFKIFLTLTAIRNSTEVIKTLFYILQQSDSLQNFWDL